MQLGDNRPWPFTNWRWLRAFSTTKFYYICLDRISDYACNKYSKFSALFRPHTQPFIGNRQCYELNRFTRCLTERRNNIGTSISIRLVLDDARSPATARRRRTTGSYCRTSRMRRDDTTSGGRLRPRFQSLARPRRPGSGRGRRNGIIRHPSSQRHHLNEVRLVVFRAAAIRCRALQLRVSLVVVNALDVCLHAFKRRSTHRVVQKTSSTLNS